MGEAVLKKYPGIREIHLSLPNKHYNLVDLSHFHLENPKEIFLPTDEPHGLNRGPSATTDPRRYFFRPSGFS